MAVTASFSNGTLTEFGDTLDNTITTSRNVAGEILVNGGAVAITGGPATVANTALIQVFGQGGADTLTLSEVNGALPAALLFGGAGNDVVTGGSGGDQLFGQADNDTLLGKGGNDFLFGGADNDTLTGGAGDDQMFGESGDDRLIWNPGDGTDLVEGGDGNDTAEVNGGNAAEVFTLTANGTRVRFDRLDPAPFSLDIGTTENIVINANGGNDTFSATGNLAALINITFDGGAGNDTILGGNGADVLRGGADNDFVDGNQGNDTIFLGDGDDVFQWDPGDGSDIVEGQAGFDRMQFNGSAINEIIDIAANGGRVRFTRDIASVTMDLNGIERIDFNALAGTDTVKVHDLTGTDVTQVVVNLAGTLGGSAGDGAADQVIADGTNVGDQISIAAAGSTVSVTGLATALTINQAEATDSLTIQGLGGNDFINATGLPSAAIKLTLDGGAGDDTLAGGAGADTFLGGDGNDVVAGRQGNDVAFLGAGDDTFVWNPGDGSDIVEGGDGTDALGFRGAAANEIMDVSANGGRVLLARDLGSVLMDLDDVERIDINALGGTDTIAIHDVTGTDLTKVTIDLAGALGGTTADGQADQVIVQGTNGDDNVQVSSANGTISVTGLAAAVSITHADGGLDVLKLQLQGGADVINASALAASQMLLQIDGGLGNDLVIGSAGNDLVTGGDGDDTALLGAGDDTFVWNPGDDNDIVEGQDGLDTLLFNGAQIAEKIDIDANGGRVRFTRDIATVTMDLNDVERIEFNALGGTDTIKVHDLGGTDVTQVVVNLAGQLGGATGDGANDQVITDGTNGNDQISITAAGSAINVSGLPAAVTINQAESTDSLTVQGFGGNDFINATGLPAAAIKLTLDGGAGDDTLAGGAGADTFFGGDGNDVVAGRQGDDVANLGAGDDTFVWNPGDGSDIVEGGDGTDGLGFRGAAANEIMDISANSGRVRMTRDVGNIVMDLDDVEHIDINALGGTDTVTVHDMTGTDLTQVNIDLAGALGGATPDGQADQVIVQGTIGNDAVQVSSANGTISVTGLAAAVNVTHADGGLDVLKLQTLDGADVINASGLAAGQMLLQIDGGLGNDVVTGSAGNDLVIGGDGNDTAFLGAGDDTFVWNPGDDNDTIEGQAGFDVLKFNGANANENIAIVGSGGRAFLFRDVANVVMDTDGVERIDFNAFGGTDNITVGDLAGTDVGRVSIDLAATPGSNVGDGAFDQVIVNATSSDDHVTVTASGSLAIVGGLRAQVTVDHAEVTDRLVVQGLDGNDFIEASTFPAGAMALTLDGGAGNDVLAGGGGSDLLLGGDGVDLVVGRQGNDSAFLGSGDDSFIWNPGDGSDFIDGEAGFDVLTFRASNAPNDITVGTNGTQAVVSSNLADATLIATNVERIEVDALGGTDNVTVNDQTRTDVFQVAIDLAANLGGSTSDGQVDHVTLNGGIDTQTIDITNSGGQVIVTGTPVLGTPTGRLEALHATQTTIDHADNVDQLLVTGGAGNDTLNASTLTPGLMQLTLDGGAGDDTLTGTLGADHFVFAFGNGADTITNFTHAAGDVVDLQGTGITSFAQLQALMTDHGTFTTIDFGAGGSLSLLGLHPEQLQANDFLLS